MTSKGKTKGPVVAALRFSIAMAAAGLIMSAGTAMAQRVWEKDKGNKSAADAKKSNAADEAKVKERTQGGARVTFTSLKDWNLKGENLSARGHNPLYFPLKPGFRYIMEYPDHPWGHLWIEVSVLDKTEKFDVPGIGKFECAVVQEEEFYDGVLDQRAENWFCIDKKTNAMYAMGEVSWEIDQIGRKVFEGTWRVGEPDGHGVAEPGMLMPSKFKIGDKYIFDGHEAEAYGYTENMETGLTVVTPAGTFKDCVRTREFSLTNPSDVTDKYWCKGIGIVRDTSDGWLYASDALPKSDMKSFGKYYRTPGKKTVAPIAKVDGLKATEIALKKVPGKANSLKIVRMGKRNVYQVEIVADKDGAETDVFVDIETGEVAGTDN
jgi:peptidase YpeB-like protein